jgi:hypothetical protein
MATVHSIFWTESVSSPPSLLIQNLPDITFPSVIVLCSFHGAALEKDRRFEQPAIPSNANIVKVVNTYYPPLAGEMQLYDRHAMSPQCCFYHLVSACKLTRLVGAQESLGTDRISMQTVVNVFCLRVPQELMKVQRQGTLKVTAM